MIETLSQKFSDLRKYRASLLSILLLVQSCGDISDLNVGGHPSDSSAVNACENWSIGDATQYNALETTLLDYFEQDAEKMYNFLHNVINSSFKGASTFEKMGDGFMIKGAEVGGETVWLYVECRGGEIITSKVTLNKGVKDDDSIEVSFDHDEGIYGQVQFSIISELHEGKGEYEIQSVQVADEKSSNFHVFEADSYTTLGDIYFVEANFIEDFIESLKE